MKFSNMHFVWHNQQTAAQVLIIKIMDKLIQCVDYKL